MKILVTGAKGQLGWDVVAQLEKEGHGVLTPDQSTLDIRDREAVLTYFRQMRPEAVVHGAAYTAVDQAEEEKELCMAVNKDGTENLALAAKEVGSVFLYISTDYVLSGEGDEPFMENAIPKPQNVYGESKLQGEYAVQRFLDRYFILRISWVFGLHGNNFVKTMLKLGQTKDTLSVVSDQVGSPTYTKDVAVLISELLKSSAYGIYHGTNEGFCSWQDFAQEIFRVAKKKVEVLPVATKDYKTKAKRPLNSRLSKEKIRQEGFTPLPPWQDALRRFMAEYSEGQKEVSL